MRWTALALLLASTPVEAHCYSVWHYPWPQRCGAIRDNTRIGLHHVLSLDRPEIPLPSLAQADLDGGEADELTRARLELLGYAHAH
jgi:hypothetical protein